jgi:macrodomain Ter protein organizer (MatP/YcbG family)
MKTKTSVYIDKDLWRRFKEYAAGLGIDVSQALEEAIKEELVKDAVVKTVDSLSKISFKELDFKPVNVKIKISDLVREMRDEREDSLLGQ